MAPPPQADSPTDAPPAREVTLSPTEGPAHALPSARDDHGGPLTLGGCARLLLAAALTGLLWGVLEGALYPAQGGPRVPLSTYWTLLVAGLVTTSLGLLLILERMPGRRLLAVLAFLPLSLVVQDWASLLMQGSTPQEATWYAAVFGDGPHTRHDRWLGLPGGYYLLLALSLASVAILYVGGRRAPRLHRGSPSA